MLLDMRIYEYAPASFSTFLRLYDEVGFAITSRHLGRTIAIFTSHAGVANRTLQLFAYRDADHRDDCRARLRSDPQWLRFIKEAGQHIVRQANTIIRPTSFSRMSHFDQLEQIDGFGVSASNQQLFDMQACTSIPGKLGKVLSLLKEGMTASTHPADPPIGCFTGETGVLDRLFILRGYDNDRQRANMTASSEFTSLQQRIAPFLQHRESDLWLPRPYSPLGGTPT